MWCFFCICPDIDIESFLDNTHAHLFSTFLNPRQQRRTLTIHRFANNLFLRVSLYWSSECRSVRSIQARRLTSTSRSRTTCPTARSSSTSVGGRWTTTTRPYSRWRKICSTSEERLDTWLDRAQIQSIQILIEVKLFCLLLQVWSEREGVHSEIDLWVGWDERPAIQWAHGKSVWDDISVSISAFHQVFIKLWCYGGCPNAYIYIHVYSWGQPSLKCIFSLNKLCFQLRICCWTLMNISACLRQFRFKLPG